MNCDYDIYLFSIPMSENHFVDVILIHTTHAFIQKKMKILIFNKY